MTTIRAGEGAYTDAWCRLFEELSVKPPPGSLTIAHASFAPFLELFYSKDSRPAPLLSVYPPDALPGYSLDGSDKRCLLGYSGGKDSLAMAMKLKEKGFTVTAFHVAGLNRSFTDEHLAAARTARAIGIDLVVRRVVISGSSDRPENPTKNLLTLAMMFDYGAPLGIAHYALGLDKEDEGGDEYNTDFNFSDSKEVLDAGIRPFRLSAGYELHTELLRNGSTDSLVTVLESPNGLALLGLSISCMSPFRFRATWKKTNEKKYDVQLLDSRCGSCYKCAIEYIHLASLGYCVKNEEFTKHCWEILRVSAARVTDAPGRKALTKTYLIENFFGDEMWERLRDF